VCTDGQPRTSCVCWRTPTTATDVLCVLTDTQGRPVCADGHPQTSCPRTSCVCWRTPTDVLCVLNRQPTWAKITQTVHGKGQRAESKDQRADMCTDGKPRTQECPVCADGHTRTSPTDVLCVLTDTHGRPVCADEHTRTAFTATDVLCVLIDTHEHTQTVHTHVMCVLADTHGRPVCTECTDHVGQNHPNSPREGPAPKQSTGRASVLSPRTNVLICVLMDSHGPRPVCADGHTRTATDDLCVLTDTHGRPVCADGHPRMSWVPRGPKSSEQSTGRASVLSPRTSVLICLMMDSHRRPVSTDVLCADGQTRTHTDSHGRPMCADQHTRTQPTWAKITQTVHGKGQLKDQRADMCTDGQPSVLCVLTDTHGQPLGRPVCGDGHTRPVFPGMGQRAESKDQRADMCTDGQPRTSPHERPVCADGHTDVLCVLADTHGRSCTHTDRHGRPMCANGQPQTATTSLSTDVLCVLADTLTASFCVLNRQPTWAKISQTSKDQRADMCTDGQPRTSCVCCEHTDTHGQPWTSCVCLRTPTDAKITRTVQGKGQRAESKDQRADMCTDGQPRTS
ncbi:unnamed protein product, partial [Brassica rapa]